MLTMPNEMVPLQMARGLRPGLDFRVAIPDIKSITIDGGVDVAAVAVVAASIDSPRASGGDYSAAGSTPPAPPPDSPAEGRRASAAAAHLRGQGRRRGRRAGRGRGA